MAGLLVLLLSVPSFGQINVLTSEKPVKIESIEETYRVVGPDSVVFCYNYNWRLVKPECATYFRHTKLSEEGYFTGPFKEYNRQAELLYTGAYAQKKKEGLFQEFYRNGKTKVAGHYKNDKLTGNWELFYETGEPKCVLLYTENSVYILSAWDQAGNQTVKNGNGTMNILFGANEYLQGLVQDSVMEGTWTSSTQGMPIFTEEFKKGEFVSGQFPGRQKKPNSYKNSQIRLFFQHDFSDPEKFEFMATCTPNKPMRMAVPTNPPTYHQDNSWVAQALFLKLKRSRLATSFWQKRGQINFTFVVNEKGVVKDVQLTEESAKRFYLYLDLVPVMQDALASLGDWAPATQKGQPVAYKMSLSVELNEATIGIQYRNEGPMD
ncbi:toxin-antitoxin system YwqK family antitoxin [Rufibacter sp. LB8]|uniref:toxin-antitoxin system YwqK family antitoxin n=1 Tax=Rufibacter sp. LB8 TaxID=2777781 RepID=UPI00178C69C3|nr:hypothetical protein [Rufibacter sp. LB8]